MIATMPRPRPPHLNRETTRHGATAWYVRVGKGPRIRVPAPGTEGFDEAYQAAVAGERPRKPGKAHAGTLEWLIARYRDSLAWNSLSRETRRQRDCILRQAIKTAGHQPISAITKKTIAANRDRRSGSPAAARHFVQTMRGLFEWAVEADLTKVDPTLGIKTPRPATDGFHVWTEEECQRFEARWPLGTRERLAFDVLLYTGLRRGDAVQLGKQHVRKGVIRIRTEKTGTSVTLPILPPLQESLDAGPTGDLVFIAGERGGPLTKESFGNWFREACRLAGCPGAAHGLRKAGATRAAEAGLNEAALDALFGWTGGRMASLYTKTANRERLAIDAAARLANTYSRTPEPGTGRKAKKGGKSDA